ncbi:MAG TPA: hypothetical protein VLF91_03320 [Candidatus Saccharimonadales bacterium]|nr:hypothetical protein [Candidatus Saccharimonadales bacterium]
MLKVWSTIKIKLPDREAGFSVVELLLAAAVFGVLVSGLIGAIVYGRASSDSSGDHDRAVFLAEEGLDAVRNIANSSYANITSASISQAPNTHGLAASATQWAFNAGSNDVDATGVFTRSVILTANGANRETVSCTVTWPQPAGNTGSVTMSTEIVNWEAGIKLWSNAIVAGSANPAAAAGVKVATQGNYAYEVLNTTSNNFVVIDISNPASPVIKGTASLPNTPTNIAVSGNYAYVTTNTNTASLEVVDITSPTAPSWQRSVTLTGAVAALGVYISGTKAYVVRASSATAGANEFNIIDISSPLSPTVLGGYNNNIQMNEVWVSGNFAYVATSSTSQEMLVINVTTPATPTLTATYNPSTPNVAALTITGFGNTVLLGMSTTLDAVNVTTPSAPARLTTVTTNPAFTIQDVAVDITNGFAFVGTNSTTSGEFQAITLTGSPISSMTIAKAVDVTGTTSTVNGVSYDTSLDVVAGSSISATQRFLTFSRN